MIFLKLQYLPYKSGKTGNVYLYSTQKSTLPASFLLASVGKYRL